MCRFPGTQWNPPLRGRVLRRRQSLWFVQQSEGPKLNPKSSCHWPARGSGHKSRLRDERNVQSGDEKANSQQRGKRRSSSQRFNEENRKFSPTMQINLNASTPHAS